jgi:hypothetical protein
MLQSLCIVELEGGDDSSLLLLRTATDIPDSLSSYICYQRQASVVLADTLFSESVKAIAGT